jgi:hypothetical protein
MHPSQGLSPLPIHRPNDDSELRFMEREGFVDEAVVAAVRARQPVRRLAYPRDLALSADDLDFADWRIAEPAYEAFPEEIPEQPIPHSVRRPAPPVALLAEPIGARPSSSRWWIAGLAGVATVLASLAVVLSLTTLPSVTWESTAARLAPAVPAAPAEIPVAPELQPATAPDHP